MSKFDLIFSFHNCISIYKCHFCTHLSWSLEHCNEFLREGKTSTDACRQHRAYTRGRACRKILKTINYRQ